MRGLKRSSDGMFHQAVNGEKPGKRHENKFYERFAAETECCEHRRFPTGSGTPEFVHGTNLGCPYPDCKSGNNNRVCISEERWGDFARFKEIVRRMIISGEECALICKRFRCTMNTLIAWVDGEKYPSESAQERIWNFLTEKEKENGYVDT